MRIADLSLDDFRRLVDDILEAEQAVHGRLSRTSMSHLRDWLRTGCIEHPMSDEALNVLRMPGYFVQVYRRCRDSGSEQPRADGEVSQESPTDKWLRPAHDGKRLLVNVGLPPGLVRPGQIWRTDATSSACNLTVVQVRSPHVEYRHLDDPVDKTMTDTIFVFQAMSFLVWESADAEVQAAVLDDIGC